MARKAQPTQQPVPVPRGCELVSLRISNGALASEELPNRIKLLNWGSNDTIKGQVVLDDLSAGCLESNQRKLGHSRIALDFEHNTLPGSEEFLRTTEPRKVAAFGRPELVRGEGLFLSDVVWTPAGRAEAKNFEDLSPAVGLTKDRRVTFIHSAALTRHGAVDGLTFFNNAETTPPTMDTLTLAEVAAAIGLAETATKEDVLAKLQTLAKPAEEKKEPEPVTEMSATIDGKVVKLNVADLVKLTSRVEQIETARKTDADTADKAAKAGLIARFSTEGKAPLGEDGAAMSNEALEKLSVGEIKLLLANTPVTVPLSARSTQPKDTNADSGLKGLDRVAAAFKRERENKLRYA